MIKVPKVFPPKKFNTFCTFALAPQITKKSVSGKKNSMSLCLPRCCSCVTTWSLLRPASSIIRPLYEWSLSAAFENDHYDFCWLNLSLVSPGIFVNSQNIVFVSMFGQLCRAVVSYKYKSGLCVCYHIPSWWAVINGIINRYCLAPTSSFLGNASGTVHTYPGVLGEVKIPWILKTNQCSFGYINLKISKWYISLRCPMLSKALEQYLTDKNM